MRALALPPLAALALLASGCGSSDDATVAATAPAAPPPAATATLPATDAPPSPDASATGSASGVPDSPSPSASRSPSPSPSPSGSAGSALRAPVDRPAADGDVDGDGRPDRLSVSGGRLVAQLSGGGTASAPLRADGAGAAVRVLGAADVDGDGRAEVWVRTGQGASAATDGLWVLTAPTVLSPVLGPTGSPLRLSVGGGVTHGAGFSCEDDQLVVRTAESDDGATFTVTTTTYALRGDVAAPVGAPQSETMGAADAQAAAYTGSCGSVEG